MPTECPSGRESIEMCPMGITPGSIRDFPQYGLRECSECRLVSHEVDLRAFTDYESGSMHAWSEGYGGTLETPEEDVIRRVRAIDKLSTKKRIKTILDFGSGAGEMLFALAEAYEIQGLEPEESARKASTSRGMWVWENFEQLSSNSQQFDLITLFHVVEHFYHPFIELKRIFELLKPGGTLLIETPNSEDALLKLYKSEAFTNFTYWSHHPMLHSKTSLVNLVEKSGFEQVVCEGVQRYGIANHLYWLANRQAGGHVHWKNRFSSTTEASYREDLINSGHSDTIWLSAVKPT